MTNIILEFLHRSGTLRLARLLPSRHFIVLNFHRVRDEPTAFHDDLIEVNSRQFREHLEWLGRRTEFISEEKIAGLHPGGKPKMLITFDDGYADSHEVIAPILERAGIPAIFFIAPGVLDKRQLGAWDRIAYLVKKFKGKQFRFRGRDFIMARGPRTVYLELAKWSQSSLPDRGDEFVAELGATLEIPLATPEMMGRELVTWDQVRDLKRRGFSIGGHSYSHRVLSSLSLADQEEEMKLTRQRLEEEQIYPRSFAFPFGTPNTYSWETREAAKNAGFEFIFSFSGQIPRARNIDPIRIDRVPFKSSIAKYDFLVSLPGANNFLEKLREWSRP